MEKNKRIDDDVERLRTTPVGSSVRINKTELAPIHFYQPDTHLCGGCYFQHRGGGIPTCRYWQACVAHNRVDGESVLFVKVKK